MSEGKSIKVIWVGWIQCENKEKDGTGKKRAGVCDEGGRERTGKKRLSRRSGRM